MTNISHSFTYKWWGAGVVICLERRADLHMAQLMPLPLTVSCSSKIQIGSTFLVPAYPGSPGKSAVKRVCVAYKMAAKINWRRYGTKLRHCHRMYMRNVPKPHRRRDETAMFSLVCVCRLTARGRY